MLLSLLLELLLLLPLLLLLLLSRHDVNVEEDVDSLTAPPDENDPPLDDEVGLFAIADMSLFLL